MDTKLLLIKAITLLYRESQLENATQNSSDTIRGIIEAIELPEASSGEFGTERDLLYALKQISFEMCGHEVSHQYTHAELLQKIRHAVRDEDFLYNAFREGIETPLDQNELKKFVSNLRGDINEFERRKKVSEIIQKAAYTLKFKPETIKDIGSYIAEVATSIEPYQRTEGKDDPAKVMGVDLNDLEGLANIFKTTQEINNEDGIMRLGWQAVNHMTQGGFRRGECVLLAGLQHNFKTGISLSMFKHIALYNKPYMIDPKKKPALVRFTFEDPLTSNLAFLYKNTYENKTGQPANVLKKDVNEMAQYVSTELQVNGYHIFLEQINPSLWSYIDLQNYILNLEANGYEVHLCMVDYLGLLPTTGCMQGGPTGSDKRDLLRRMRNFFTARKTTFVTPWQLSTEAKVLIRNGLEDTFVKEIANKGYYDSCRTIDQEADLEIYFHIVKADGKSYLTLQRGKHRLINQTLNRYLYCVLPFQDIGDIRDDLHTVNSAVKKPGGMPVDSEEKNTFWSFDA